MMFVCEMISLVMAISLCYFCTRSDLRTGLIYNKILLIYFLAALFIDALYYGLFVQDLWTEFLVNFIVVTVLSLYLFFSHSFAGGDCKMMIVLAMLYPARQYLVLGNSNTTLVLTIAFAILAGYVYLLIYSVWKLVTKKNTITFSYVKNYCIGFLKSYLTALVYIAFLNVGLIFCGKVGVQISSWFASLMCLLIAWCVGRFSVLKKLYFIIPITGIVFLMSFAVGVLPISINPENYFLVFFLLFCQMTIRTSIYEEIEVEQLKKGMILTTFSSVIMQTSITKGLPRISTEDLKSRLTEEEVDSIKIWAKATKTKKLSVVKKIPFAVFISVGFLVYWGLWGMHRWL